ncbi:uncharacterized protein LOC109812499 isoform X2 [Cajanus cajan]|uniref:uncharacterized protein LOC109812499 isoform X2 n=1 Tax=Cajanus cajan TaxID=3821 RepID=UPI00098D75BF|nr:uncharacterized protein LOC109812499 isoform X2 [Cajanus cajan]
MLLYRKIISLTLNHTNQLVRWQMNGTKNSFNHKGKGPEDKQDFSNANITSGAECSSNSCGTMDSFNLQGRGQQIFSGAHIRSGTINPEQNDLSFLDFFNLIMRLFRRKKQD